MSDIDDTPEQPAAAAPSPYRPRSSFFAATQPSSSDSMGTWGDREDVADRLAFDAARRAQLDARPPHH